jgi:hypothetical protein
VWHAVSTWQVVIALRPHMTCDLYAVSHGCRENVEMNHIIPCNLKTCVAEFCEGAMRTNGVVRVVFSNHSNLMPVHYMGHI